MYEDLHSQGLSYHALKESHRMTSWAMHSSIKSLKQRQKGRLPISPDQKIPDFLLEGYSSIARNEETEQLLALYRLLRHLAEIPWLLERGFQALAERNSAALKDSLRACHHSKALPRMGEHALGSADEIRTSSLMSSQPDDDGGGVRQSDTRRASASNEPG